MLISVKDKKNNRRQQLISTTNKKLTFHTSIFPISSLKTKKYIHRHLYKTSCLFVNQKYYKLFSLYFVFSKKIPIFGF